MEFCKYGSLLSYMHRERKSFINQLDPSTDKIDPSICTPTRKKGEASNGQMNSSCNQQESSNGYLLDNYNGDYQVTETEPLKSTDLLSWAFQASKGMEYLSSRRVKINVLTKKSFKNYFQWQLITLGFAWRFGGKKCATCGK